jgi:hypothetical protein
MSWFTLTEGVGWSADLPIGAEQLPFRYAHLSASVSAMARHTYAQNLLSVDPSDTGPPLRYVEVAAFARWAEHRRCGPDPGALLAKALFGFATDERLMLSFTRHEWVDAACGTLGPALATLCLAIDDVKAGELGADLSVALTTDLVWFMARCAMVLTWIDWDRAARLDSTCALPVVPLCRECLLMATRRIAMGKGLDQRVAEDWRKSLTRAVHDVEQDTPLNRLIRAELEQESSTAVPSTPL